MDANNKYSGHSMKHSELDLFDTYSINWRKKMPHHKIWESGRNPYRRPDKGKKKPQMLRQASKRLAQFKKTHTRPSGHRQGSSNVSIVCLK